PALAPLLPDVSFDFIAGPFLLPGAPFTPGPELVDELGMLLVEELSAASAGAMPINVATVQAARICFMAISILCCSCSRMENVGRERGVPRLEHSESITFLHTMSECGATEARRDKGTTPQKTGKAERAA